MGCWGGGTERIEPPKCPKSTASLSLVRLQRDPLLTALRRVAAARNGTGVIFIRSAQIGVVPGSPQNAGINLTRAPRQCPLSDAEPRPLGLSLVAPAGGDAASQWEAHPVGAAQPSLLILHRGK